MSVLDALDDALLWPAEERPARLAEMAARDPALAGRIASLLRAEDAAGASLPTEPTFELDDDEPEAPERMGVYRIAGLLGEGGMGTVWLGRRDDGLFEQTVAIKLMRPSLYATAALQQFETERRMLARLRHSNIAQLFDGGSDAAGRAYFIMEYVEGESLGDYALAKGLGLPAVAALVEAVCAAVHHAHSNLVVHADIKPGNILVDREGRPKLLDFGIARSLQAADDEDHGHGLTQAYASPQRHAGERPMPADDVYALGAVLHEMASGEPPDAAPPRPLGPAVCREFAAVVAKATAADAARRYESAAALAADLRRWIARRPVEALPPGPLRAARLLVRRRPLATGAGAAAALGLVAALAVISALYLRAEAERREADRRFADARGMAHYMLFDLFDRLTDTPGTLPLRRALADKARSYLHNLSAAPRAPAAVRAEAAIGFMQLAGVDGLFAAGELGARDRTAADLEEADRLLAENGRAPDPRWRHARGRLDLFDGFRQLDQGGGVAAAIPMLRRAVERLGEAAGALPADVDVAVDLWQARLMLADAHATAGDWRAGLAVIREALAAYLRDKALLDRSETAPLLLARSYKLVGQAQMASGATAAAVATFTTARATLEAEDALHPRRSRTLFELLDVRSNLIDAHSAQGRYPDALATAERALAAVAGRLAIEPDNDNLQRMKSLLETQSATLLLALDRPEEALAAARSSLDDRSRRRAARPGDRIAWRDQLFSLKGVVAVMDRVGDRQGACGYAREARLGLAAFALAYPSERDRVEADARLIEDRLAGC